MSTRRGALVMAASSMTAGAAAVASPGSHLTFVVVMSRCPGTAAAPAPLEAGLSKRQGSLESAILPPKKAKRELPLLI